MIGIINVQWFDNPGAVLLCYALQQKLTAMGYDSQIIDYASGGAAPAAADSRNRFIKRMFSLFHKKYKLTWVNKRFFYAELRERHEKYEDFREQFLVRTKRFTENNSEILKGYDAYIVGSDVVWKPAILESKDAEVYFLDFLSENDICRRVAFAASVGTADASLLERLSPKYAEKLKNFDAISVREKATADFFQKLSDQKIECLLDPVFLLNKKDYISVLKEKQSKEKYIYFYMLEPNEEAVTYALFLAKKTQLPIYFDVHDKDNLFLRKKFGQNGRICVSDGPSEFLSRIDQAEYVVTNSFHGTAFSIIFEKEFYSFSCYNAGVNVSLRMENLLQEVGLEDRFNPTIQNVLTDINYETVNAKIMRQKKLAVDFLTHALR